LIGRHEFRVGSTADDPHHAISVLPAVSVGAELCYFPGKFQPGDVLRSAGRRSVSTQPLQKVRAIECGTLHVNDDFLGPRLWFRNILDFQDVRAAETSDNNSSHDLVLKFQPQKSTKGTKAQRVR
jgi:hypothetical protein